MINAWNYLSLQLVLICDNTVRVITKWNAGGKDMNRNIHVRLARQYRTSSSVVVLPYIQDITQVNKKLVYKKTRYIEKRLIESSVVISQLYYFGRFSLITKIIFKEICINLKLTK